MTEQDFNPQLEIGIQRSPQEELQMKRKYLSDALSLGDTLIKGKGLKPDEDGYYSLEIIASSTNPDEKFLQACTQARARGITGIDIVERGSRTIESLPTEEQKKVETYAQRTLVSWSPDQMIESVPGYSQATAELTQNQAEEQQEQLDDERKAMAKRVVDLFLSSVNSSRAQKRSIGDGWMEGIFLQSDSAVQDSISLDMFSWTYGEIARGYKRDEVTQGPVVYGTEHLYKVSWNEVLLKKFLNS